MLNLEKIRSTPTRESPFPHLIIERALDAASAKALETDFPEILHTGSIPVSEVRGGPAFQGLLQQLASDEFRRLVEEKFQMDLQGKPIMTTVRGRMRAGRDGRVHTDSRDKLVTILIYFNRDWQDRGGRLRLLRSADNLDDCFAEIAPELGNVVMFKVTPNGWHGHLPVEGKRLSLQMNYLSGDGASSKHEFMHRLSARIKKIVS